MSIITKPFTITRKEFSKIYKIVYYSDIYTKTLLGMYFGIGILCVIFFKNWLYHFGLGFLVMGTYSLIKPHININRRVNKLSFQEKTYRLDNDSIEIMYENGSHSIIELNTIIKFVKINGYCFICYLYERKSSDYNCECFPISIFYSEDDADRFIKRLKDKMMVESPILL